MIPFSDFGGQGAPLCFLHANGYPPECYRPLLGVLTPHYRVLAMHQRPLWPHARPEELQDWHPLSTDFLRFLDEQTLAQTVVIGHSMGGIAALRAALQQPERFRALILLDPVLFPPGFILFWRLVRALGWGYRLHPLIPAAQKRRRTFDDLERPFASYRRRPAFRYLSDDALRIYLEGVTQRTTNNGYTLRYSPEWETHIYYTSVWRDFDLWRGLPRLKPPALLLRGAETDTFLPQTALLVRLLAAHIQIQTLPRTTHLLPLEAPQEVAERIIHFLGHSLPSS
ncbi:MAG: alpha/beta hydrolase [Anaerolineales bacterium]|nr:alpha/beta hydrolase [Anaerolineales bacterium]MDW8276400.1 alpha/beta hydrolase [Anaerolineales bacterium]